MSADNAIYVRPLKNGKFAVKCISSLYPEDLDDEQIDSFFEGCDEHDTLEDAELIEDEIVEEYYTNSMVIEYGTEVLHRKDQQ